MKKIVSFLVAGTMLAVSSVTAFAIEYPGNSQNTTISTSVAPAFTVSIPADTSVAFDEKSTSFGSILLDNATLLPTKAVKVTINSDGELNNSLDSTSVIPYSLTAAKDGSTTTVGTDYSAMLKNAGDKIDLTIDITQAAWDAADAGDYSDVVKFTIAYVDA